MESVTYEDLYDVEKRPGAGVGLATAAVELQLERVRDANYRHRLHNSPNEEEKRDDPAALDQLQADVYFLALAVRRVLLFHDLLAKQLRDPRLAKARAEFIKRAPLAKTLRDLYEHLDEYLLDSPKKKVSIPGRAAPVLLLTWGGDDVIVAFGPGRIDVTAAAVAAIELGRATQAVWDEYLDRTRPVSPDPPSPDDGIPRMFEVTLGLSTVIGGVDDPPAISTGTLLGVNVREMTSEEHYVHGLVEPGEPDL